MNVKFSYLSSNLYKLVSSNFKTRYFPDVIFDSARVERYGRSSLAYNGRSESLVLSKMVKDYIVETQLFKEPKFYHRTISILESFAKRTVGSHMFLKVQDSKGKTIIIDPSYKSLLYRKFGHVDQWFSEYTEYLFHLDPVFIGTERELNNLLMNLSVKRCNDIYHENSSELCYSSGIKWYKEAEEYTDEKYLNQITYLTKE